MRFSLALFLVGCSGAPFTSALVTDPPPDAAPSPEGSVVGIRFPPAHDAGTREVMPEAAALPEADPPEASACTRFSETLPPIVCAGTYEVPTHFALAHDFPGNFGCNPTKPTPDACRCAETYTCECILATSPCESDGLKLENCAAGNQQEIVVTCQ